MSSDRREKRIKTKDFFERLQLKTREKDDKRPSVKNYEYNIPKITIEKIQNPAFYFTSNGHTPSHLLISNFKSVNNSQSNCSPKVTVNQYPTTQSMLLNQSIQNPYQNNQSFQYNEVLMPDIKKVKRIEDIDMIIHKTKGKKLKKKPSLSPLKSSPTKKSPNKSPLKVGQEKTETFVKELENIAASTIENFIKNNQIQYGNEEQSTNDRSKCESVNVRPTTTPRKQGGDFIKIKITYQIFF